MANYWIGVAVAAHVRAAVNGGFAQLGHGRHASVKALELDDWIVFYSPRENLDGNEPVQAFTALGRVTSREPYLSDQVMTGGDRAWRVDVEYEEEAQPTSVRPLLDRLSMTRERGRHWGMAFRQSRVQATEEDLRIIAEAMGATLDLN